MLTVNIPANYRYVETWHFFKVEFNFYVTDTSCSWSAWSGVKFLLLSAQTRLEIVPTSFKKHPVVSLFQQTLRQSPEQRSLARLHFSSYSGTNNANILLTNQNWQRVSNYEYFLTLCVCGREGRSSAVFTRTQHSGCCSYSEKKTIFQLIYGKWNEYSMFTCICASSCLNAMEFKLNWLPL